MRNKVIYFFIFLLSHSSLFATNLEIKSKIITLDKKKNISIFENDVVIKTNTGETLKSDYAEYDKKKEFIILKNNITVKDKEGNFVQANYAEYNENSKIFKSTGPTKILTTENYVIESSNILFDRKSLILSENDTEIIDKDKNSIFLTNLNFLLKKIFLNQ